MKKVFLLLFSCMLFSISIQAQLAEGVKLDHDTIVLAVGQDTTLVASVLPDDATERTVTWTVLSPGLSYIDTLIREDTICDIHAVNVGTAKIVVATKDGTNRRDTCVIQVVIPVAGISLSDNTIQMDIDDEATLTASILPNDATDQSIIWENLDPSLVRIEAINDNVCSLKALAVGEAKIVAQSAFDNTITDTCVIEVSALPVASLTLSENNLDMDIDTDTLLIAHLLPAAGIDKSVLWISDNTNIVEVLLSGTDTINRISAKSVGIAKIIAKSVQDILITDTCVVTVYGIPVEGMTLNHDTIVMHVHKDTTLLAQLLPGNATNDSIEWTSTDSATVDITSVPSEMNDPICKISALKSGWAKIAAKTFEGDFMDTCVVHVIVPVDSLVMNIDSISMDTGDWEQLDVIVYPDTATYKTISWTSSDISIVDTLRTQNNTTAFIQAYKSGIATVYATTLDGLVQDSCVVTVNAIPVDSVYITMDSLELIVDSVYQLTASLLPTNATDKEVIWTSSDLSIVTILSSGTDTICDIQALQVDTAIIYVTTIDGGFVDSCVVIVLPPPVIEMKLRDDSLVLYLDNDINTFIYYLEAILLPFNAPNRDIEWTSSDAGVVDILTTMSHDTICQLIPMTTGTATIYARALGGEDIKDSCFVTVKDQFLVLETDTTAPFDQSGIIELSLIIPDNSFVEGSFQLHLPEYFGLTKEGSGYKTALDDGVKDDYDLSINRLNDSIYSFEVKPVTETTSRLLPRSGGVLLLKLMDIAYTIYEDNLFGNPNNFIAKLLDIVIELNDGTTLEDDRIDIIIKTYREETGNIVIVNPANLAFIHDNRLVVNSDKAETVYVYSLNGSLLFATEKTEGQAVFNLNIPDKVLIVRGSSGWTNKIVNP